MKRLLRTGLVAIIVPTTSTYAAAQITEDVIKIGVIVDKTGVYSANRGPGAVKAVEMAVRDFGGKVLDLVKPADVGIDVTPGLKTMKDAR